MTDRPDEQVVTMTTYRPADPDEFYFAEGITWRTDLSWLDDDYEPVEVLEEVWVLKSKRTFTWEPPCDNAGCKELARHWGLCERHAREDDPEFFARGEGDGEATSD